MKYAPGRIPPPPADAHLVPYVLVHAKKGWHYRRARGTVTKATLNQGFQAQVDAMAIAAPVAKQLVLRMRSSLHGIHRGRFIARLSAALRSVWTQKGYMDYSTLLDFDFQPEHPLDNLLKSAVWKDWKENLCSIKLDLHRTTGTLVNSISTDYYFELILLSGDPLDPDGLRVDSTESKLYTLKTEETCHLSMLVPDDRPWMLMLKMSCLEGRELANASRYYGMKVIAVG